MPQAETPAPQSHDMKSCSSLLNNQCAKYSMKLMGIGIEMIMKKYGLQLCIGKKRSTNVSYFLAPARLFQPFAAPSDTIVSNFTR